jgi:hypothetical protein
VDRQNLSSKRVTLLCVIKRTRGCETGAADRDGQRDATHDVHGGTSAKLGDRNSDKKLGDRPDVDLISLRAGSAKPGYVPSVPVSSDLNEPEPSA